MKLQNEHVFVTGGANGIGAAIVLDVAQSGAKVSFCDLAEEAGKEYEKELTGKGFQVFFHQGDVANFDNLKVAHTAMVAKFGMVTGIVNNAGVNSNADPVEMTNDQWNRFIDVDLKKQLGGQTNLMLLLI